jgi:hypothetical protein
MEIHEPDGDHLPDNEPTTTVEQCKEQLTSYLTDAKPGSARMWAFCDMVDENAVQSRLYQLESESRVKGDADSIAHYKLLSAGLQLRELEHIASIPGYLAAQKRIHATANELAEAVGNPEGHIGDTRDLKILQEIRDSALNQFLDDSDSDK